MRDNDAPSPIDPEADNARDAKGSKPNEQSGLNAMARQMVAQYERNTLSPTMLSGVIRLVEFGIVMLTGMLSFTYYVSFNSSLILYYFLIMLAGGAFTC